MRLTIVHQSPPRAGARQVLSGPGPFVLGRHPECDAVFDAAEDASVSARHAEIRLEDGRPLICDLGSTNGLVVNGRPTERARLAVGDKIRLGPEGPQLAVEHLDGDDADEPEEVAPTAETPVPGSPSQASTPVDDTETRYGKKTVGLMIQNALARAGGHGKSTEYFEALVEKRVSRSTARLRWIVLAAVVVLALAGGGIGTYLYRTRSVQVIQTTQVGYGDTAGGSIAAHNRYTVFMLAGQPRLPSGSYGPLQGFCTAFAVRPQVLATNAHCVNTARERFAGLTALMNGSPAHRYPVTKLLPHPAYQDGRISPDVGLLRIDGQLTHLVTVAPAAELAYVAPGLPVFMYGFPGRLNREEAPEATFIKGDIGRVTTFDQRLGDFGQNTLVQHSAYSSPGTSGSPLFNAAGKVIGINAGGYTEEGGEKLTGYNFGMRIDLIESLVPLIEGQ